jgi:RimJ/RimL family protein N-acetyltransferase
MTARSGGPPTLYTERLCLRAHRTDDFDAMAAMWADPIVVRHIGGVPSKPQQTWMRMLAYAGHWSLLDFGYWAIADRATDAYFGELGFANFKRDVAHDYRAFPELGWALSTSAAGNGFATEATRAVSAWGDARFDGQRTVCLIDPENASSIRVAQKCGYGLAERVSLKEKQTLLFTREPAPVRH